MYLYDVYRLRTTLLWCKSELKLYKRYGFTHILSLTSSRITYYVTAILHNAL